MRRLLLLVLCLMLLPAPPAAAEENHAVQILGNGSFFPLPEPEHLTAWVVNLQEDKSVSDSYVQDWILEKTNVSLEIVREFTGSDAKRQLNLSIETEKQLPDILLCTHWTKAECSLYGARGIVVPLDPWLPGCENWNRLNEICGEAHQRDLTMPDGHIYCFGTVNECFHLLHQARMWVYQPWIDLLCGGKLPETTEEFREYLRRVAEQDPNGNGEADEIPLTGQLHNGWAADPFTFLSNSFVHNNTIFGSTNQTVASGCYIEEGIVHCNWTEEGFREALRYMNGLYRTGLLHGQVFTQNSRQLDARIKAEPHLVGAVAGGYFPVVLDEQLPDGSWSEWTCLAPLSGPEGLRLSYQSSYDYFYNCNGLITRDCRNPEIAAQLFDILAGAERTLVQNYGQEGIDWAWCGTEEGHGVDHADPLYRFFPESLNLERGKAPNWPPDVQICSNFEKFRNGLLVPEEGFNGEAELWKCAELYEQYSPGPESVYPNIAFSPEETQKIIRYQSTIEQYVEQSVIDFVTGYMDPDSDWEAYLSMLAIQGQKDYHRLLQEAYDRTKQ